MITHRGTAKISTQRLTLRRFTIDDADAMFNNWAKDHEVTKYLSWDAHPNIEYTNWWLARSVEKYERIDFYYWAIVFEGEVIGCIGGSSVGERGYDIGYCIGRKWWNRGIMTEAVKAVIDFAFNKLSCTYVELSYILENKASARVAEKCGMRFVKKEKRGFTKHETEYDLGYYRIDRKEE